MSEVYTGTKFRTVVLSEKPLNDTRVHLLTSWGMQFAKKGLAPQTETGHAGNLSVRTNNGFLISGAGISLAELNPTSVAEVVSFFINTKKVLSHGIPEPSSEAFMHGLIYLYRPDVMAVFHGHSDLITSRAPIRGFPVTEKEVPYGTIPGAKMVANILKTEDFCIIKNHGFVTVGSSVDSAGELTLQINSTLK